MGNRKPMPNTLPRFKDEITLYERHIRYCHDHGVLGVVDNGTPDEVLAAVRTGAQQDKEVVIRRGRETGGDFFRLALSADIGSTPNLIQTLPDNHFKHLLLKEKQRKKVIIANGPQAVAAALAAGCDAIEQGYMMGADNLARMADKQVLWIPSLMRAKNGLDSATAGDGIGCRFSLRAASLGNPLPGAESYWKQVLTDQLEQLRLARELDVPTAVGTGAGNPGILHGESVVEELKLFLKAGYCLAEALGCASEHGARFFDMKELGALQIGRPATFLVTRGTPHQLPRKLAYLENIYVNGTPSRFYRKNPVKVIH
jgi:hypothetical protein